MAFSSKYFQFNIKNLPSLSFLAWEKVLDKQKLFLLLVLFYFLLCGSDLVLNRKLMKSVLSTRDCHIFLFKPQMLLCLDLNVKYKPLNINVRWASVHCANIHFSWLWSWSWYPDTQFLHSLPLKHKVSTLATILEVDWDHSI